MQEDARREGGKKDTYLRQEKSRRGRNHEDNDVMVIRVASGFSTGTIVAQPIATDNSGGPHLAKQKGNHRIVKRIFGNLQTLGYHPKHPESTSCLSSAALWRVQSQSSRYSNKINASRQGETAIAKHLETS